MKQNVWIKAKSSKHYTKCQFLTLHYRGPSTFNHVHALTVEDDNIPVNSSDSSFQEQIKEYRNLQSSEFVKKS
jgi:hypothetical protein